jgi:hypothetical protein
MRRAQMQRPQFHEVIDLYRELTATKYCSHPVHSDCEGPIVKAHTVPKSGSLRRIAKEGHVYQFRADLPLLKQTQGKPIERLIGINEASTFTGFCSFHDNQVFAPIEAQPFQASAQHAFLLAYRSICRELFAKDHHVEVIQQLKDFDRGLSVEQQIALQDFLSVSALGAKTGQSQLKECKVKLDAMLIGHRYDDIRFCAVLLDQAPEVVASGSIYLEYDFHGNTLQPFAKDPLGVLDVITFSVIATEVGGAVVFSWIDETHGACTRFVESLNRLAKDRIGDAIVRFLFTYCENTFFSPSWWEAQAEQNRDKIRYRANLGTFFTNLPRSDSLTEDGFRFVRWNNLKLVSNVI